MTFAYFSDGETTSNTFAARTIDLLSNLQKSLTWII
ncbi:TasA family protein [Oceanobacillus polygoni]